MSILSNILLKIVDYEYNGKVAFTRESWAQILGIKVKDIEDWLSDTKLPVDTNLRSLFSCVVEDTRMGPALASEFKAVLARPARETTPHWQSVSGYTLGNYMVGPVLRGFIGTLQLLPAALQEKVLFATSKMCRELREEVKLNNQLSESER